MDAVRDYDLIVKTKVLSEKSHMQSERDAAAKSLKRVYKTSSLSEAWLRDAEKYAMCICDMLDRLTVRFAIAVSFCCKKECPICFELYSNDNPAVEIGPVCPLAPDRPRSLFFDRRTKPAWRGGAHCTHPASTPSITPYPAISHNKYPSRMRGFIRPRTTA